MGRHAPDTTLAQADAIRSCADLRVQSRTERERAGPRITLAQAQGAASVELDGLVLEAQFACGERHLVFTTEDVPYEECLHIHLLDARLQVLDHLALSAWYSPGILQRLEIAGPRRLSFAFFGADERWCLTVSDAACWRPWFGRHPVQRRAGFWRRRWLQLERLPDA